MVEEYDDKTDVLLVRKWVALPITMATCEAPSSTAAVVFCLREQKIEQHEQSKRKSYIQASKGQLEKVLKPDETSRFYNIIF